MKLKTTFDSEDDLLSLRQAGLVVELWGPTETRRKKSCCLSLVEMLWASGDVRTSRGGAGTCLPSIHGRTWCAERSGRMEGGRLAVVCSKVIGDHKIINILGIELQWELQYTSK